MLRTVLGSRIELEIDADCTDCCVEADLAQFETSLVNMAVNARDAMEGEGPLTISVRLSPAPDQLSSPAEGEFVAVSVADEGHGIDSEQLERIFESFFTTKDVGRGTGLGLSQVYGFAKQSGGEIEVRSEVGKGTTFTLYLPRAEAERRTETAVRAPAGTVRGQGRVLVVEDNEEVGVFSEQALADLGFETILVSNAADALTALEREPEGFNIVFSDVVMPGMSGVELGGEIRARWPQLPVVLTTGYSHVLAEESGHAFPLLRKPYSVESLARTLREALS